jgi:hypothetical protein
MDQKDTVYPCQFTQSTRSLLPKFTIYRQLTNGGGVGEHERCKKLSAQLGIPVSNGHVHNGHLPSLKYCITR